MCLKTGGSHAGVMKLVGDAVSSELVKYNTRVTVLGWLNIFSIQNNFKIKYLIHFYIKVL